MNETDLAHLRMAIEVAQSAATTAIIHSVQY